MKVSLRLIIQEKATEMRKLASGGLFTGFRRQLQRY